MKLQCKMAGCTSEIEVAGPVASTATYVCREHVATGDTSWTGNQWRSEVDGLDNERHTSVIGRFESFEPGYVLDSGRRGTLEELRRDLGASEKRWSEALPPSPQSSIGLDREEIEYYLTQHPSEETDEQTK